LLTTKKPVVSSEFPKMLRDPCFVGQSLKYLGSTRSIFHGTIR